MITEAQGDYIRTMFESNPAYDELIEGHPLVKVALDMLPDTSGIKACNVIMRDVFDDAIMWSKVALGSGII